MTDGWLKKKARTATLRLMIVLTTLFLAHTFMLGGLLRGLTTNRASLDPTLVDGTPDRVAAKLAAAIDSDPLWKIQSREDADDRIKITATRTTRVFGFVDDILIDLKPAKADPGTSKPQADTALPQTDNAQTKPEAAQPQTRASAKSQSRVGKGDLGQNPRNLRQLLDWIQTDVSKTN